MLGVILSGGKSTRMKSDKGMLKQSQSTWAEIAENKLKMLRLPVVISVNPGQYKEYTKLFTTDQLIVDNETLKIHGPLLGVLSIHLQYPSEDLFVLACDMPAMEHHMLSRLSDIANLQASPDAFVFTSNGEAEPLCGIYRAKGLSHVVQLYNEKKLAKHSMKFMLEHIETFTTPLADDEKQYFRNINTHAELNGL